MSDIVSLDIQRLIQEWIEAEGNDLIPLNVPGILIFKLLA